MKLYIKKKLNAKSAQLKNNQLKALDKDAEGGLLSLTAKHVLK